MLLFLDLDLGYMVCQSNLSINQFFCPLEKCVFLQDLRDLNQIQGPRPILQENFPKIGANGSKMGHE